MLRLKNKHYIITSCIKSASTVRRDDGIIKRKMKLVIIFAAIQRCFLRALFAYSFKSVGNKRYFYVIF